MSQAAGDRGVRVGLIWAQCHGQIIGSGGSMPWNVPEDLAHFRRVTTGSTVIMGRRTWQSLPERFRPLPGRRNIVLTRQTDFSAPGADVFGDLDAALSAEADQAVAPEQGADQPTVWVMGGGEVYRAALDRAAVVEVTDIDIAADGDTVAPWLDPAVWVPAATDPDRGWHRSESGLNYRHTRYQRRQARLTVIEE